MSKQTGQNTKRLLTRLFNLRTWSDWERTRTITAYFLEQIQIFFVPKKRDESKNTSFAAEVAKLKLTESDLIFRQKNLMRLVWIMLGMAFFLFAYALYQLMYGSVLGVLLSWVLMFVALVLAFRYHFWYFQIKERKLGCTIREWFYKNFMSDE